MPRRRPLLFMHFLLAINLVALTQAYAQAQSKTDTIAQQLTTEWPPSTGEIRGCIWVVTPGRHALEGIKVWVDGGHGHSAQTDNHGCYKLTNVPWGTHTVRASRDGWGFGSAEYQDKYHTVTVPEGSRYVVFNGIYGWPGDPIVYVPGWNAGAEALGRVIYELANEGHFPFIAELETSPLWTPPLEVNAKRVKDLVEDAWYRTGRKVILYGHSMGGLVARAYLESGMYEGGVSQIFTFGSPHLGLPSLLNAASACHRLPRPDAVCQMSKVGMAIFNQNHLKRKGVDYHLIAGDAPMWSRWRMCFNILGKKTCTRDISWPDPRFRNAAGHAAGLLIPSSDDALVETCSASGMPGSNIDRYLTREVHQAPNFGERDYFGWDGAVSQEGFAQCSKRILIDRKALTCGRRGDGPPLSCLGLVSLKDAGASGGRSSEPGLEQRSRVNESVLRPGESVVRVVSIEGGATAFFASWEEGQVGFSLIDPTGKIISPAYAASIQGDPDDPEAVEVVEPDPDAVFYAGDSAQGVYYFPAARPGAWRIVLKGGSDLPAAGASVSTAAGFDSPLTAGFSSDRLSYDPGSTATLRVSLSEPVLSADVQVKMLRVGGSPEIVPLTRINANEFEAKYLIPGLSGYVALDWSITGQRADGVAFERGGREFIQVHSTVLQLGRGHTDRALPRTDVAGLNSALAVSLKVSSDYEGGALGVFAELTGPDGSVVARTSASVPAQRGENNVELRFRAEDIYLSKVDGPYTVRNVRILDERDAPLLSQEVALAHTTRVYTYRSFAPMPGTPSVFFDEPFRVRAGDSIMLTATGVDPEGEVLAFAWDLDNDQSFEVSGQSVPFTTSSYEPEGLRTVRVRVADPEGNSAVAETPVEIFLLGENRPPVARCRDVTVSAACGLDDSVNDGSYDPDSEDVLSCVQTPPGPYPVGSRRVTLTCTDSAGLSSSCEAVVTGVERQEPMLTLHGESEMTLECGVDAWMDPGVKAWDSCGPLQVHRYNSGDDDGDGIPGTQDSDDYGPGPNISAEGSYPVEYIAWNTAGDTVSAVRWVHVDDRTPPALKLKGPSHMTHPCGNWWEDPGVEAVDACYGNVTPTVVTTGYVNGWAQGAYTVLYEVRDSGGNSAPPVSRTVEVVGCPW